MPPRSKVPASRVYAQNAAPPREDGDYVIYWMIAQRRLHSNFALDRALEWARGLKKSLLIFEPLRCDYRWASDRLHRFVLEGMAEHFAETRNKDVLYFPYVEPKRGAGKGLLAALAERAALIVTDHYPCFFIPEMVRAAAATCPVRLEAVDGNGLFPLQVPPRLYKTKASFRRFAEEAAAAHALERPVADPLARLALPPLVSIGAQIEKRWPRADPKLLDTGAGLETLPIDHTIAPVRGTPGGRSAAQKRLASFLEHGLARYADERSEPDESVNSGLSPYLHFGHLGAHEVHAAVLEHERAEQPEHLLGRSPGAVTFLDQLLVWRELGFNMCTHVANYGAYESLPEWARGSLEKHATDPRPALYSEQELREARTADPLWNAAQRQLVEEGQIHNYLRMLWGKRMLEWTPGPRAALESMIELNNAYALDGRDPNSYSGIFWIMGRYDRPWPERPIFGVVRSMSSAQTQKKHHVRLYLERYGRREKAAQLELGNRAR